METPAAPLFEILTIPHKGQSVFATRSIRANTALFQEPPLITISAARTTAKHASLPHAFSLLPAPQKTAYLALCNSHRDTPAVLGIWKTNTFVLDAAGVVNAVFCTASRLNHACRGGENARWEWCAVRGLVTFWTDRDIEVRVLHF